MAARLFSPPCVILSRFHRHGRLFSTSEEAARKIGKSHEDCRHWRTGLIGTKLTNKLRQRGHEVVQAAPSTGVNTITGNGLGKVLSGADIVVDVSNSPTFEDSAVLSFFETSSRNLLAAETAAKVKLHVALSVVGTDRLPENGYFRGKLAQERLIRASTIPYTILRATQFFEFVGGIVDFLRRSTNRPGIASFVSARRFGRCRRRARRRRARPLRLAALSS